MKNLTRLAFTLVTISVMCLEVAACTTSTTSSTALSTTTFQTTATVTTSRIGSTTTATLTSSATASGLDKIQHFVFIMQENRSFDSYFGTYPGAKGIPSGVSFTDPHDGTTVTPYHDTNDINLGGPHGWINAQTDIDNGKMDGFLNQAYKGTNADGTPFVPGKKPGTQSQGCNGIP
jgi:phospholipase C